MRRRSIWSLRDDETREFARDRAIREANQAFKAPGPQTPPTDYAKAQRSFQEVRVSSYDVKLQIGPPLRRP